MVCDVPELIHHIEVLKHKWDGEWHASPCMMETGSDLLYCRADVLKEIEHSRKRLEELIKHCKKSLEAPQ